MKSAEYERVVIEKSSSRHCLKHWIPLSEYSLRKKGYSKLPNARLKIIRVKQQCAFGETISPENLTLKRLKRKLGIFFPHFFICFAGERLEFELGSELAFDLELVIYSKNLSLG